MIFRYLVFQESHTTFNIFRSVNQSSSADPVGCFSALGPCTFHQRQLLMPCRSGKIHPHSFFKCSHVGCFYGLLGFQSWQSKYLWHACNFPYNDLDINQPNDQVPHLCQPVVKNVLLSWSIFLKIHLCAHFVL